MVEDSLPGVLCRCLQDLGGDVAFCALQPSLDVRTNARGYAVPADDLLTVLAKENGRPVLDWEVEPIEIGDWCPLPVALAEDGFKGKYNALRLSDVDGRPAYTVTTSHVLNLGAPSLDHSRVVT